MSNDHSIEQAPSETVKATCTGISKKTGKPCKAPVMRGGTQCAGHAGLGVGGGADETTQALRMQGVQARVAAVSLRVEERKKTLLDRIAEGLEERAQEILGAYLDAGLEKGDWRALEALVTRVHGKPVEKTEDITRRDIGDMTQVERDALRAELLSSFPHLRAV